jgi:hypothetical protein|nr:MAG TPA: antitoxin [Caudoviricetes sp.]
MKKIIDNKKYNTDTAKELGSVRINEGDGLYEVEETLYQKRNREFFLYGWGGAATKYSERVGSNNWCSGARIMPLSYDEAREWAERNLSTDEYESIFGVVSEGEKGGKSNVTFHLSKDIIAEIDRLSAKKALSKSEIIEKAIKLLVERG